MVQDFTKLLQLVASSSTGDTGTSSTVDPGTTDVDDNLNCNVVSNADSRSLVMEL